MSNVEPRLEPSSQLTAELERSFGLHLAAVSARAARALEACHFSGLLVHSGSLLTIFEDDRTYPFEAHAPFKVWAPVSDVPDCLVYVEPGAKPLLLFHRPTDFWHKAADLPRAYWTKHFDVRPIEDLTAARPHLPRDLGRVAYIGDPFTELSSWGVAAINPRALMRHLDFDRAAKTPYELACLREATRLGVLGHLAAAQAFAEGASEFEIELQFLRACGLREQELPYNPIIALNEGGAVLHYQMLERQAPAERLSMLIDAGAEFGGYASDITRTHALRSGDFATLIEKMDELQQTLCAGLRPGVDWRDVHLRAHELTGKLLREADITTCPADEAVATGVTGVFLPHGIGHLLGIEVHDAGGLMAGPTGGDIPRPAGHPFLRLTRVLQKGFVVTVEPGIYFIDQLLDAARADGRGSRINWSRIAGLRKFGGIRIEDNVAITDDGGENLTRDAFAALTPKSAPKLSS
ncbi:MAG TPA: Xaa-Pro dipeptidase [Steroidobacteraceae bacterium]|nr:Xaa-Pro dipeptidase [Steroidobacteraceae bacterium]